MEDKCWVDRMNRGLSAVVDARIRELHGIVCSYYTKGEASRICDKMKELADVIDSLVIRGYDTPYSSHSAAMLFNSLAHMIASMREDRLRAMGETGCTKSFLEDQSSRAGLAIQRLIGDLHQTRTVISVCARQRDVREMSKFAEDINVLKLEVRFQDVINSVSEFYSQAQRAIFDRSGKSETGYKKGE